MILNPRSEPTALAKDDPGIGDWMTVGCQRANAKRGSQRLLNAIIRVQRKSLPKRQPRPRKPPGQHTWPARKANRLRIEKIQMLIAGYFGVAPAKMKGHRGDKEYVNARQVAMFLSREITGASYPDIGKMFGGKDHTTVMHACSIITGKDDLQASIIELRGLLGSASDLG